LSEKVDVESVVVIIVTIVWAIITILEALGYARSPMGLREAIGIVWGFIFGRKYPRRD